VFWFPYLTTSIKVKLLWFQLQVSSCHRDGGLWSFSVFPRQTLWYWLRSHAIRIPPHISLLLLLGTIKTIIE
jgi:hypothetical protein